MLIGVKTANAKPMSPRRDFRPGSSMSPGVSFEQIERSVDPPQRKGMGEGGDGTFGTKKGITERPLLVQGSVVFSKKKSLLVISKNTFQASVSGNRKPCFLLQKGKIGRLLNAPANLRFDGNIRRRWPISCSGRGVGFQ